MSRTPQEQANLDFCVEFYEKVICDKNPRLIKNYVSDTYIQHSAQGVRDGYEGVFEFITFLENHRKDAEILIKEVFVDGDNVIFFVRVHEVGYPVPKFFVDRFRMENGRIKEHWDIGIDEPEDMPHGNGMW